MKHPKRIIVICSIVLLLIITLILLFACHNTNDKKSLPVENSNPTATSTITTAKSTTTTSTTTKSTTAATTKETTQKAETTTTTVTTAKQTQPTTTKAPQTTQKQTTPKPTPTEPPQTEPPATEPPQTEPPQTEPPTPSVSFDEDMYNNILKPYAESIGYDYFSSRYQDGFLKMVFSSIESECTLLLSVNPNISSLAYWNIIDNDNLGTYYYTDFVETANQAKAKLKEVAIEYGFYNGN